MTYRQFYRWCSKRAHDGCWGYATAVRCLNVIDVMKEIPFWRRKKEWKQYEQMVLTELVNPTNERIRVLLEGSWNDES